MKSVTNIIIITAYAPSTLKHIAHLPKMCAWNPFLPNLKGKAKDPGTAYEWNMLLRALINAAWIYAKSNLSPLD